MKVFIDLRGQILDTMSSKEEAIPHFAFYCTVVDRFETFSGECTWHSKQDFIEYYDGDELERFLSLIPDWVPDRGSDAF